MRLVFVGTPQVAVPVVETLCADHEICAVLTRPPAAQGRSAKLVASPVQKWAEAHGVPVLAPSSVKDPTVVEELRTLEPDCCPVVAYGGLITTDLLMIPRHGWINLHFSLLPAYRGAAPVQRALLDGRTRTGVTTFRIVKQLDAGPIFDQVGVNVAPGTTAGDLLTELSLVGAEVMRDTLESVVHGARPRPQPEQGVSIAPKITPGEAQLDLNGTAERALRVVAAMSPEPGAWAHWRGERFKVLRAIPADISENFPSEPNPGKLWRTKKHLYCALADGWIDLVEVQPAGKRAMAGLDWARGVQQLDGGLE